jgi:hypothetical protein
MQAHAWTICGGAAIVTVTRPQAHAAVFGYDAGGSFERSLMART